MTTGIIMPSKDMKTILPPLLIRIIPTTPAAAVIMMIGIIGRWLDSITTIHRPTGRPLDLALVTMIPGIMIPSGMDTIQPIRIRTVSTDHITPTTIIMGIMDIPMVDIITVCDGDSVQRGESVRHAGR
jgi:hypothetical protein